MRRTLFRKDGSSTGKSSWVSGKISIMYNGSVFVSRFLCILLTLARCCRDSDDECAQERFVLHFPLRALLISVVESQNVAQRSVFINTAMLLWSFNMRHKKDSQGVEISIDNLAFTRSANWHPLPFSCDFSSRFEGVRKILENIDL